MSPMTQLPLAPAALATADLLAEGVRYERSGVVQRARECFETVAERAEQFPALAAEALWHLANLHRLHSAWDDALHAARASADIARRNGLDDIEADALNIEGGVYMVRAEYGPARELFARSIAIAQSPGIRAKALQNLGGVAAEERDFVEGERLFMESREAYRSAGDARGEAVSLLNIGRLQAERGDVSEARLTLEAAISGARLSGDMEMYAAGLLNLGIALGQLGLTSEAEERITTAYGQFTIADIPIQRVRCLMQLGTLASDREEHAAARMCLTHALTVAKAADLPRELRLIEEQLALLPASG